MDTFIYLGLGFFGLCFGACIGMGVALGFEIATLVTGKGRFFNFTYVRIQHVEESE